uniref:Glucuronosyltransferase n=1 Tax=Parascaris equorum TaxID=6256 RepID=A0A914RII9_PAREQ
MRCLELKQAGNAFLQHTYSKAARRLSSLIRNKPNKPEEQVMKWTAFVAEYGALPELHVEGASFNFIKYFGIDLLVAVLVTLLTAVILVMFVIRRTMIYFRREVEERVKKTN